MFSSASQKQSVDVITVSRNNYNNIKQPSLVKPHVDKLISSNFLPAIVCIENPHSCLTSNLTNSKVNLSSQCTINEIHLNIFPPTGATYCKASKDNVLCENIEEKSSQFLNVNIQQNKNVYRRKSDGESKDVENQQKLLPSNVNVSFQRCDSILHISIGNSSKVMKRNKNKFRFLSKLRIFSRKRRAKRQCQMFFTSQIANDNTYHIDDDSLNIINDDLMITINKGSQISEMAMKSTLIQSSDSSVSSAGKEHKSTQSCDVNSNKNSLHYNFDKMDNELDDYMREIKRREKM